MAQDQSNISDISVDSSGRESIVTQGRGLPTYEVGPNPWNPQPSVCERSFTNRRNSTVYQQLLDESDRTICALANANDESWAIPFENMSRLPVFTTSIPDGRQDAVDEGFDTMRSLVCEGMDWIRQRKVPFSDLCGGTLFSSGYNFSSPTISSADVIPYCGIEMGLMCSSMIGDKYATTDTTELEEDCNMAAWNAACLSYGQDQKFYNPNINDLSYNQQALGLMPFWCACACFHSCVSAIP